MEDVMRNVHTGILGAIGILAVALLTPGLAEAGASASAPSKYRPNQIGASHQEQQARKPDSGITEFSSSARRPSQRQSHELIR
jgi:hypothetical protein